MDANDRDIFVKARFLYASLSKSERRVADVLFDEGKEVVNYTLAEYARRADCSEASIIRFCRKAGAKGYTDFRERIENSDGDISPDGSQRIVATDSLRQVFQKIAANYERTLQDTLALYSDEYDRAFEAISRAAAVHFFGVGDAHLVCEAAQMKFARTGKASTAYSDTAMMLTTGALAGPDDVVVAISFEGRTRVVLDATRLAKENGATIICILHNDGTKLGKLADIPLFTATTDITPAHDEIARRTAEHAIIDTLYMALVTRDQTAYGERSRKSLSAIEAYK